MFLNRSTESVATLYTDALRSFKEITSSIKQGIIIINAPPWFARNNRESAAVQMKNALFAESVE